MLKQRLTTVNKRFKGKRQYSLFFILFFIITSLSVFAQETSDKVQMADGMRSSGKIYVVVAVLLTVLTGLILYLVRLDKKISRLEKERNK